MKNFNEIWEEVANGVSKEELLKAGADEKQIDTAINLETLSRDGEINLSTSEIDNMSFDKAKDLIDLNTAETSYDSNVLNKLAETSTNEEVLKAIVENTDTSIETLETIANKTDNSEIKELLNEKFEEAVKDGIKDYIDSDGGMRFDSKFHDFVDEKMGLNSVDLVEDVKYIGLENVIEGQVEAFSDYSDVQNSKIAYDLASSSQNENLLETLSKSDDENVLRAVAENSNTSEETLNSIANKTDNEQVLIAVIENENVSNDTLEKIALSETETAAIQAIDILQDKFEESQGGMKYDNGDQDLAMSLDNIASKTDSEDVLLHMAETSTNSEVLNTIANKSDNEETLRAVAENSNTTEQALESIVNKTDNAEVLSAVANNENTLPETLDKIADKTENAEVLSAVIENDNVSNNSLMKLAEHSNKEVSEASLDKLESRVELSKQIESDSNKSTDSEKTSEKSEDKQADEQKQSSGSKMKM